MYFEALGLRSNFLNIRTLLFILAVLSITKAELARKREKTYPGNTVSENRSNGLALTQIYCKIPLITERVITALAKNPRKLDSLLWIQYTFSSFITFLILRFFSTILSFSLINHRPFLEEFYGNLSLHATQSKTGLLGSLDRIKSIQIGDCAL